MTPTHICFTGQTHQIAEWYLPYLVNGDNSGLDDEEQMLVDSWFDHATDDWRDADDNLWVYAHLDVVRDSREEFAMCDVATVRATTVKVTLYFRLGK
jgi:hypothetical protein